MHIVLKRDSIDKPLTFNNGLYICWAQSMDLCNPWISLRKSRIRSLSGQSMDCALIVYAYILECVAYSVHVHGLYYKPASYIASTTPETCIAYHRTEPVREPGSLPELKARGRGDAWTETGLLSSFSELLRKTKGSKMVTRSRGA